MITGQLRRIIEIQDNLKQNDFLEKSNIISFISGKGGTGKTVLSLITAISLVKKNNKVLLIDLDLGFPNINILLNQQANKSLDNFCFNNEEFTNSITEINKNLHIVFGLSENPLRLNSTKHILKSLITEIKKISKNYDYVILDTGAGIDEFKLWLLKNSVIKMIVTNDDPASIMDAYALIKIYENSDRPSDFFLLINKCQTLEAGRESYLKLNKAVKSFLKSKLELFDIITENDTIKTTINNQDFFEVLNFQSNLIPSLDASLEKLNKFIQLHNINHSS
jgi:flagellar biosynthesis protein FlhG